MYLRHVSIRVPWHDTGWEGRVCEKPDANASCQVLGRIREARNNPEVREFERRYAGSNIEDIPQDERPPCLAERMSFMAPYDITQEIVMSYSRTSDHHKHVLPTNLRFPRYGASLVPFRWMMKDTAEELGECLDIGYDPEREPNEPGWLAKRPWVQGHVNQRHLLDGFAAPIQEGKSLCFFYAKNTPLADDERRVIIGVGLVRHKGTVQEFDYDGGAAQGRLQAYMWERPIQHSIRPKFSDGFVFPYQNVAELARERGDIDTADYVAFVPQDLRGQFSYASEHMTHGAAISALLACRQTLDKIKALVDGPWEQCIAWVDSQLNRLWRLQGPCPGLGSALYAFGVTKGTLFANGLAEGLADNEDPWPLVDRIMEGTQTLSDGLNSLVKRKNRRSWVMLKEEDPDALELLRLLSRFELTKDQAKEFFRREDARDEFLSNPYLLYEYSSDMKDPVSIWTIDRGVFPAQRIRDAHPLPGSSGIDDPEHELRIRAITVEMLEQAAADGDTLLPSGRIIESFESLPLDPPCELRVHDLKACQTYMRPAVHLVPVSGGQDGYQLDRYGKIGQLIRDTIAMRKQQEGSRKDYDWLSRLNEDFGPSEILMEMRAREEKSVALAQLSLSRFSVLIGQAGTGKTTLLRFLCDEPSIAGAGALLLAPTGKARVRLQIKTGHPTQTLAQFLLPTGRYDAVSMSYRCTGGAKTGGFDLVIVDEASMLTEDMLGALLDSLDGQPRIILVGDPQQLPPIGAGRPFVDLVAELTPEDIETLFPRVGPGYAELTVQRRQGAQHGAEDSSDLGLDDVQLAALYSGRTLSPGEDEIVAKVFQGAPSERVSFFPWSDEQSLEEQLVSVLVRELGLAGPEDQHGFSLILGGTEWRDMVFFNRGAASHSDDWQILSPVHNVLGGTHGLNRRIQELFRSNTLKWALECNQPPYFPKARITAPRGPESIVYGDKVMCVRNHRRGSEESYIPGTVYPKENALCYVANGEIGIVVGQFKKKGEKGGLPKWTNVEFSSQQRYSYGFNKRDFNEEAAPILELAYAVTVHKAQGSEFGLVILVLPHPCRILSRELMYTALTRQTDKVVVLHQGARSALRALASPFFSETARRITNLFSEPDPIDVRGPVDAEILVQPGEQRRFLEHKLIHRSSKGEALSSKSEVIIADALADAEREFGIRYHAEQGLRAPDGSERWPDFTIEDPGSGLTFFWEHLGLLGDEQYERRWKRKLAWYREQGIKPYRDDPKQGRLIITRDGQGIGIDSAAIRRLIREVWGGVPTGADLDLFEPVWRRIIQKLSVTPGVDIEPGADVSNKGEVVGSYLASLTYDGRSIYLVDSEQPEPRLVEKTLGEKKVTLLDKSSATDQQLVSIIKVALGIDQPSEPIS